MFSSLARTAHPEQLTKLVFFQRFVMGRSDYVMFSSLARTARPEPLNKIVCFPMFRDGPLRIRYVFQLGTSGTSRNVEKNTGLVHLLAVMSASCQAGGGCHVRSCQTRARPAGAVMSARAKLARPLVPGWGGCHVRLMPSWHVRSCQARGAAMSASCQAHAMLMPGSGICHVCLMPGSCQAHATLMPGSSLA